MDSDWRELSTPRPAAFQAGYPPRAREANGDSARGRAAAGRLGGDTASRGQKNDLMSYFMASDGA